jgi:O-antigen/teichoic acid export membrane protein
MLGSDRRWLRVLGAEWADPVSRGGLLMMANTAITGGLGLIYWTVAARLYSQSAVGRASALVSMASLLATVGQLNLGGTLVRFLNQAGHHSRRLVILIYALACGSALVLTVAVELAIPLLSARGSDLRLSPLDSVVFSASVLATVLFALQDYVLIGIRRIGWLAVENGGFGLAKLLVLIALAGAGGWSAVFASWMLPLVATLPVITWLLFRRMLPQAERGLTQSSVGEETKRRIRRFAIGDAIAGVFLQSWTYALPPIVVASLGSAANAKFYAALLFASVLDLVAANYAGPLVVEATRDGADLPRLLRRAAGRIYLMLIPPTLLFFFAGGLVLHIYGGSYASAAGALALLSLASLPRGLMTLYYTVCNIHQRTYLTAWIQGTFFLLVVVGTLLFAHDGITAVAEVVLVVTVVGAAAVTPALLRATAISKPTAQAAG